MIKIGILILAFSFISCGQKQSSESTTSEVNTTISAADAPQFNADSAYKYTANQVAFGPRVPNTKAHKDCGDYLISELKRLGAKVFVQETMLEAYDGTKLEARNIIGSYDPDNKKRIMLFAHWDSRPFADSDPDEANHYTPIDGADDGAGSVGALLEIARQINQVSPNVGIDIIFFDAEDYGVHEADRKNKFKPDSWCLGSQFWAKNPHVPNYTAEYGILLDMVGHKDAVFYKELISMEYASPVVEKIWNKARSIGYGKYFINAKGGGVTDDHEYVIKGRRIPCANIVYHEPNTEKGFGEHWHTLNDTMDNIDKATLKAVGQTVLEVIYNEK